MQNLSIPISYFPTTALFLDDSHDFLLNFVLQLDEGVAYNIFNAPHQALDWIRTTSSRLDSLRKHCLNEYLSAKNYPLAEFDTVISLDLAAIYAEVYNPHRFTEISVVVVDYAMPEMDGLEFCRLIGNDSIKKILLTGQADEKLAIAAFNEGLIHRYIKKSDINAAQLITKSIYELELQYFQARSDMTMRSLALSPPACLFEKKFVHFFQALCKEHDIIEYYNLDQAGSFLMLDDDANMSVLLMKNELYNESSCAVDLKSLASSDKILGFNLSKLKAHQGAQDLVATQRLLADSSYSYTYKSIVYNSRLQKILSYHRYLEELDAQELSLI